MKIPYTYLEVEAIDNYYDQQIPLKLITETVNADFHNGQPVRSIKAIQHTIYKINNDDQWYNNLEQKWLGR